MNRHLTDEQLIDRLYCADSSPDTHLEACPRCARRWEALQERRARIGDHLAPDATHLAWQRRRIMNRLEEAPRQGVRWAPVLATGFLLAAGAWLYRPATDPQPAPIVASSETAASEAVEVSWFEDTYSATQTDEPRAAGPMRVLFEQPEEKVTE